MPPELSGDNILQELGNTEGMAAFLPGNGDTKINYSDVENECQGALTSFLQNQWIQVEGFSSFMPDSVINSPGSNGIALEVAGSTYPAPDPFSPSSSEATMVDSPPTSEDSSSPPAAADGSAVPKCNICQWKPDTTVKRSFKRLAAAVEKHITRNHRSKDSQCPICYQLFKNRPDNVRPHVVRKHPEMLASLYPTRAVPDGGRPQTGEKPGPKRRASMPQSASHASPARGRHLRFKKG